MGDIIVTFILFNTISTFSNFYTMVFACGISMAFIIREMFIHSLNKYL